MLKSKIGNDLSMYFVNEKKTTFLVCLLGYQMMLIVLVAMPTIYNLS
jgi:hypothetical protein